IITSFTVFGQKVQVKGTVADSLGTPIPGALINLQSENQKLVMSTDVDGVFAFPGVEDSVVRIRVQSMGYDSLERSFSVDRKLAVNDMGTLALREAAGSMLDEVVVEGMIPVVLKED